MKQVLLSALFLISLPSFSQEKKVEVKKDDKGATVYNFNFYGNKNVSEKEQKAVIQKKLFPENGIKLSYSAMAFDNSGTDTPDNLSSATGKFGYTFFEKNMTFYTIGALFNKTDYDQGSLYENDPNYYGNGGDYFYEDYDSGTKGMGGFLEYGYLKGISKNFFLKMLLNIDYVFHKLYNFDGATTSSIHTFNLHGNIGPSIKSGNILLSLLLSGGPSYIKGKFSYRTVEDLYTEDYKKIDYSYGANASISFLF